MKRNRRLKCLLCPLLLLAVLLPATQVLAQTPADSAAADSILLQQVEQQMQATAVAPQPPGAPRSSLNFNPHISLIGDFQGAYISKGERNLDAYLHETEIGMQAVVDPYARADFFISFERDPVTHAYGVDVEEGYLTTLSLPARLQLKVGKFKQDIGRVNPIHSHALPFIDMPDELENLFGDEGLNDDGASLSWLVPNKAFYQEVVVQATAGFSETPSFARSAGNRFIYLGHLKNFFTLSDNATLELGFTGVSGENDSSYITNIAAADVTYKWKPVQLNTYHSITWQSEFFFSNRNLGEAALENSFGLYSFLRYQVAQRWFLTGRYDYAQQPTNHYLYSNAFSLTAAWEATEFQKIELEAKATSENNESSPLYQAWLRWIFVIGAHGAHQY